MLPTNCVARCPCEEGESTITIKVFEHTGKYLLPITLNLLTEKESYSLLVKSCTCIPVVQTLMRSGLFPTGSYLKSFYSFKCLEICRFEILEHQSSVYGSAKVMFKMHDVHGMSFDLFYSKLSKSMKYYNTALK
jgi:hypothetical protein